MVGGSCSLRGCGLVMPGIDGDLSLMWLLEEGWDECGSVRTVIRGLLVLLGGGR